MFAEKQPARLVLLDTPWRPGGPGLSKENTLTHTLLVGRGVGLRKLTGGLGDNRFGPGQHWH